MTMDIYWAAGAGTPTTCELCGTPLKDKEFVDGKTNLGPWAIMCRPCHRKKGWGLGLGRGQLYDATGRKIGG